MGEHFRHNRKHYEMRLIYFLILFTTMSVAYGEEEQVYGQEPYKAREAERGADESLTPEPNSEVEAEDGSCAKVTEDCEDSSSPTPIDIPCCEGLKCVEAKSREGVVEFAKCE